MKSIHHVSASPKIAIITVEFVTIYKETFLEERWIRRFCFTKINGQKTPTAYKRNLDESLVNTTVNCMKSSIYNLLELTPLNPKETIERTIATIDVMRKINFIGVNWAMFPQWVLVGCLQNKWWPSYKSSPAF